MMRKMFSWFLTVMLALLCACAFAEGTDDFFARLEGIEWSFCSGVGGWSTDMRILPDGSFSGEFHDSEMGDTGEGYPNGTIYLCSFIGRLSLVEQVSESIWKVRVDSLIQAEDQPEEEISDGLRFVRADVYGLSEGDEMLLYAPGTPVEGFTEDMIFWSHLLEMDEIPSELESWFLYSAENSSGFVGFPQASGVTLANPWTDMTAEELQAVSGLSSLAVPNGADTVLYRWLDSEKLAEVQFSLESDEFCLRAMPFVPENGISLPEISGMYFDWENVEDMNVGEWTGSIGQAQTGSEDWVERLVWYDETAGMVYSLAVYTTDPDGLDLTAIAEQICYPAAQ